MHTYDRINLAECSLATWVRLYRPALSFRAQHLWDDLEPQTHVRTDPWTIWEEEGGRRI